MPANHPDRFTAWFVGALDRDAWADLGIYPAGLLPGRPVTPSAGAVECRGVRLHNRAGLSRNLDAALREQLPHLRLTSCQTLAHIKLWWFFAAHQARRVLRDPDHRRRAC